MVFFARELQGQIIWPLLQRLLRWWRAEPRDDTLGGSGGERVYHEYLLEDKHLYEIVYA